MLDQILEQPFAVARHRSTLFGPFLDDYLVHLRDRGHTRKTLRGHAQCITLFGEFLSDRAVRDLAAVRRSHIRAFARSKRAWKWCRASFHEHIIAGLLRHLAERGRWRDQEARSTPATVIDHFCQALADERGLRPTSISTYRHLLGWFLRHLGSDGTAETLRRITIDEIDQFIVEMGRVYSRASMRSLCGALRLLLRYLHREQVLPRDLSSAVMLPRFYAYERLPCALPWKTVRRFLDSVDRTTAVGRRDRAILLLLATYGLRPGEIALLCLEDIDWKADKIQCRRIKAGRPLLFPLTVEVGEAIADYLRRGRPPTQAREIFIRKNAPHVGLGRGSIVSGIVRDRLIRAGIESQRRGAYVLRHSLAVELIRQRHPIKTVTDMLGHRDPRVAFEYTKLSLEDLHGVALPAREVLP
jgi:site-specific recombinase XerD